MAGPWAALPFPRLRRAAGSGAGGGDGTAHPPCHLVPSSPRAQGTRVRRCCVALWPPWQLDLSHDARRLLCPFPTPGVCSSPATSHLLSHRDAGRMGEAVAFAALPAGCPRGFRGPRSILSLSGCYSREGPTVPFPRWLSRKAHTSQIHRVLGAAPFPGAATAGEVSAPLLATDHGGHGTSPLRLPRGAAVGHHLFCTSSRTLWRPFSGEGP